jgi:hypothetical protein
MTAGNTPNTSSAGLLQTKIKDLTPEKIAALEKPLGTSSFPFPMWKTQRVDNGDGTSSVKQFLSKIADDTLPMEVYSERPYDEVIALALCDMPVPSMLNIFQEGLERRLPSNNNRQQFMLGDPGAGKSFLAAMQGRLRTKKSIEVFDCGGKNINELLFETVLDFGTGDALPTSIDKRLKAGMLQDLSIAQLQQLPSGALSTDADGKLVVDWNYFKTAPKPGEAETAYEILKKVSEIEGLDKGGGNALGMNTQYGPLIKAFMDGREIVLDEYNKSKDGSDNGMQTVLTFLNGDINSCTVDNPLKNKDLTSGPASFTFRREDTKVGFFVTFTGNKTEDGATTRSLNQSVYSRLSPVTLPDPTEADWAHRISQMMVGIPVVTLYHAFQSEADANPEAFGDFLMAQRKKKAQIEGVPVPELQEKLLENWQDLVYASEHLAQFYSQWADLTNYNKIDQTGGDLFDEVDPEYSKKEGIDFRKVIQHLAAAIPIRPKMLPENTAVHIDFKNFGKIQPILEKQEQEGSAVSFGTRLMDYLDTIVYEKTEAIGKHLLYQKIQAAMDAAGLRDIVLHGDGAKSGQKSVEKCLDITDFDSPDLGKQALAARKVFCDYVRSLDKDIQADDENIITVARLKKVLAEVGAKDTAKTKELFAVNHDLQTLEASPLAGAHIEDSAEDALDDTKEVVPVDPATVISHGDFLAALALPTVGTKNLDAIWDTNIRNLIKEDGRDEQGLYIAENTSPFGIGLTTLQVLSDDAAGVPHSVAVHIIRRKDGKTLIVSDAISDKLEKAFNEAGNIIHVDRHSKTAQAEIEAALGKVTAGLEPKVKGFLKDAFGYRYDVGSDTRSLSAILADDKLECMFDKYVKKNTVAGQKLSA